MKMIQNDYIEDEDYKDEIFFKKKQQNKDKFCKKNKTGNQGHNEHIYENNKCIFCGKINPIIKNNFRVKDLEIEE